MVVVALLAMALLGCTPEERKAGSAERIQVEDTHVFLSPEGEPSTYQLKPLVYPAETASQKVYYRLRDNTDREFLEVSADGVLQARKLKQDEDGNNIDIYVRIISAENSDVTLDVKVTIEIVKVQRISFNPSTININVAGAGVDLKPIFYPAHAITGRNLIYSTNDKTVATVDASGHVTPVGIGQCSIWVQTPKEGAFDEQVDSYITINVVYTSMQNGYRLDLVSSESTLKQIAGEPEEISFVLSQLDPLTDNEPNITWYINSTTINDIGVKDNKVLTYLPTALSIGEYNIRAVLSNTFETTAPFVSETIRIYGALSAFSADILQESEYAVGDNIMIKLSHSENAYPPESYKWKITTPSGRVEEIDLAPKKYIIQIDNEGVTYDLDYEFTESGEYTIQAEAIVKGKPSGVYCDAIKVNVGERRVVNDISGLYFDGTHLDQEVYSTIIWNALPYSQNYTAQVKLGEEFNDAIMARYGVELSGERVLSDFTSASGYFGMNSFRVPNEIIDSLIGRARDESDNMMNYSYSIRIKGDKCDEWTDWYTYSGDINVGVEYFDEIIPGMNRYIANMEEYGRLINYLIVFRPAVLESENVNYDYELELYVPFTTETLDKSIYPIRDDIVTGENTAAEVDALKLFDCALSSYTESVSLSLDVISATLGGGATNMVIKMNSIMAPTTKTEFESTGDEEYIFAETNSVTHYAVNPRGQEGALPIDGLNRTMEVATTDQLYLAVAMGYKPLPTAGSVAENVWQIVRTTLNGIISDDMSATAKALAIYEWLSINVTYDNKIADIVGNVGDAKTYNAFYLEGVFIDKLAVCDGIAKAYSLMCGAEGIPTFKIVGTASGIAHAWNEVLLEEGWYVVDATWASAKVNTALGDNLEVLNRDYFAMGKTLVKDTRTTYGAYPELNAQTLDYAFTIKISETYDSIFDTDGEVAYYVETFLYEYLGQAGEVWVDCIISEEYFNGKGDNDATRFNAIIAIIQEHAEGDIAIGCTTGFSAEEQAKIYIHYVRR